MEKKLVDSLSERISVAETLVKYLLVNRREIGSRKRNQDSLVGTEMEIECVSKSLKKRLLDLEKRERECDAYTEGKLASEEEELSVKRQKLAPARFQRMNGKALKKLKTIDHEELKQKAAQESLTERERKVSLIIGTLDERISAVQEREKEFNFFLEGKMREMALKEEEFVEQVRLADARIRKQEKLENAVMEKLEWAETKLETMRMNMVERFKEIRENVSWASVALSVKEADLIGESMEKLAEEFEKMKSEFDSFQKNKTLELDSKEQLVNRLSEELVKKAKLWNEQLIKRERSLNQLVRKLQLAQDNLKNLKDVVYEKFRKNILEKTELNLLRVWVEETMDAIDPKVKELEEKEERINRKEERVMQRENELKEKEKELDMKEKNLLAWQQNLEAKHNEVDSVQQLNEQRLKKLDAKEKSLNSVRGFINNCFKEHLRIKRNLKLEKDLVEKTARFLGLAEESLEHAQREMEFREKQHVEEYELEQQRLIKSDESVDLKFTVRMDGKNLQMFLNDPEKDLESMGDEIFKVLHLSSDPAQLVLDALEGFYPPHLRKGDTAFNVRRTCIVLLKHLIRMSKTIKPHVREVAIERATTWKSKMRATIQVPNSLEVLGFLFLLAAYNLASCFDKDEISSLLKMVAQHRESAELHHILGLPEITAGERRNVRYHTFKVQKN